MPSAPASQALFQQPDHGVELGLGRRAIRHAHDHQPQRVVADQHAGVHRGFRETCRDNPESSARGTASTARSGSGNPAAARPCRASAGATEKPQWPMISVVTPWRTLLSALGLIGSVKSEWVLMSMKPGATARPAASMIFSAGASIGEAIAAIRPSSIATIAGNAGAAAAVEHQSAADQDVMHRRARGWRRGTVAAEAAISMQAAKQAYEGPTHRYNLRLKLAQSGMGRNRPLAKQWNFRLRLVEVGVSSTGVATVCCVGAYCCVGSRLRAAAGDG